MTSAKNLTLEKPSDKVWLRHLPTVDIYTYFSRVRAQGVKVPDMAFQLDEDWLLRQSDDTDTRHALREAIAARSLAISHNQMPDDTTPICLRLAGLEVWLETCAAFSAIEVYQEIFRDNGHFLHPAFDAMSADVIVDIGANLGFYALRLRQINPACRLLCVEANPIVYAFLRKNLDVNGFCDVQTLNAAVADRPGQMTFSYVRQISAIGGKGIGMVKRPWLKSDFVESAQVKTVTLSDLRQTYELSRIDLLKIDIEGMELEAIRDEGQTLNATRRAVIERHSPQLRQDVIQAMQGFGFALVFEDAGETSTYYSDLYFDRISQPLSAPAKP